MTEPTKTQKVAHNSPKKAGDLALREKNNFILSHLFG